ncbi:MAG: flagellar assembly protein FliW [Planctomycetes bacterium]|nr:flagellar assembly protein FliW [Planctomycetota bacterium]
MFTPALAGQSTGPRSIATFNAGVIAAHPENIVTLVEPLAGLGDEREFLVFQTVPGPLYWWQSTRDRGLALCCLDPFAAGLDPDMVIEPMHAQAIDAEGVDDIIVHTLLVLEQDPTQTRTNLRAPILIGRRSNKALQVILDDPRLPVKGYIMELVARAQKAKTSC